MVKNKRVLVAMSGGVDSSMAAAILKQEGYEVIGATMKIWPEEYCTRHKEGSGYLSDNTVDAKKVCAALNIRHYVLNFEKIFRKEVIDYFSREYLAGRTPNPCIICNEKIKFGALLDKAKELECDFISTGHHARIERNGFYRLRESIDKTKDQSYVLFRLTRTQIQKTILPIGDFNKDSVKDMAKKLRFNVYKKPESQEICFVPGDNYADFIKEYCGIEARIGNIVDSGGKVLGTHNGYWNYTIGQRRGLGLAHKSPLYVTGVNAERNIIVVGDFSELKKRRFIVKDINWVYRDNSGNFEAMVKIRYNHKKAMAFLRRMGDDEFEVEFRENQEAITPGQAAVFYDGEYVLGGGWIDEVLS